MMSRNLQKAIVVGALSLGIAGPSFAGLILKFDEPGYGYTKTIDIPDIIFIGLESIVLTGAEAGEQINIHARSPNISVATNVEVLSLPEFYSDEVFLLLGGSQVSLTLSAGFASEFILESFVFSYKTFDGMRNSILVDLNAPEPPVSVPEPSSLALIAMGALGLVGARCIRRGTFVRRG